MAAIRTTRRLLTAYADEKESCEKGGRDEAQSCLDIEERLAWGVQLFRGLMALEARTQAHALRETTAEVEQLLELMPLFYPLWIGVSERYMVSPRSSSGTDLRSRASMSSGSRWMRHVACSEIWNSRIRSFRSRSY